MNLFKIFADWLRSANTPRPVDDDPVELLFDRSIDAGSDWMPDDQLIDDACVSSTDNDPGSNGMPVDDPCSIGIAGDTGIDCQVNPANGLPMIGGCSGLDVHGNLYGMDDSSFDTGSAGMDADWPDSHFDYDNW